MAATEQITEPENGSEPKNSQPQQWYLYMVRCANGHLYTGVTTDVERRFAEHQSGSAKSAKFLRGKGPLTLAYFETVGSHSDALKREIVLKKWPRAKKLALIATQE
ncbi:GIY-YIG nuclease family protein [Shewanella sp. 125m-1]